MRSVSAREANQSFSRILREAEAGEAVVSTRRGRPVAVVGPLSKAISPERERPIERAITLMQEGLPIGNRWFTRDDMHER